MIKVETIGMLDRAVINPVLKADKDVTNYTFITADGDLYLISNTIVGDDSYVDGATLKAGECLNGYLVKAFEGQKLVVDEKHIAYGDGQTYANITAGTTLLKVNADGKLEITVSAPTEGVYFKVTDKTTLTGKAVKVKVVIAGNESEVGSY